LGTPVSRQYNQYFRALYGLPRWNRILLYIYVTYWVGGERLTLHTGVRFNPRSGHVGIIVDVVERGEYNFFLSRVVVKHYSNITIPSFINIFD
jgi:hypothetical protein